MEVCKFGRKCSQLGIKYLLIGAAVMTSFSVVLWLSKLGRSRPDADFFTAMNVVIMIALAATYGLGRALLRQRTINGETFKPERYALIADELRMRGITRTRRFIAAHPDHVRYSQELSRVLAWTFAWDKVPSAFQSKINKIEALIYSEDNDPERTKDALINIITERGISDYDTARELLHTLLTTETPLGSGVL